MRKSNYDKSPFIAVPGADETCVAGWPAIGERLRRAIQTHGPKTVVTLECYPGVDEESIIKSLRHELKPMLTVYPADALKSETQINRLCEPFLGGNDPVFGYITSLDLPQFF